MKWVLQSCPQVTNRSSGTCTNVLLLPILYSNCGRLEVASSVIFGVKVTGTEANQWAKFQCYSNCSFCTVHFSYSRKDRHIVLVAEAVYMQLLACFTEYSTIEVMFDRGLSYYVATYVTQLHVTMYSIMRDFSRWFSPYRRRCKNTFPLWRSFNNQSMPSSILGHKPPTWFRRLRRAFWATPTVPQMHVVSLTSASRWRRYVFRSRSLFRFSGAFKVKVRRVVIMWHSIPV